MLVLVLVFVVVRVLIFCLLSFVFLPSSFVLVLVLVVVLVMLPYLSNWLMRARGRPSAALPDRCFAMLLHTCGQPSEGLLEMILTSPSGFQNGAHMGPKWLPRGVLEHLGLPEASWSGPGGLLERSWAALGPNKK